MKRFIYLITSLLLLILVLSGCSGKGNSDSEEASSESKKEAVETKTIYEALKSSKNPNEVWYVVENNQGVGYASKVDSVLLCVYGEDENEYYVAEVGEKYTAATLGNFSKLSNEDIIDMVVNKTENPFKKIVNRNKLGLQIIRDNTGNITKSEKVGNVSYLMVNLIDEQVSYTVFDKEYVGLNSEDGETVFVREKDSKNKVYLTLDPVSVVLDNRDSDEVMATYEFVN